MVEMDEQVLEDLYMWIDQVPLSRPKKDLKRDFSDGVLVAEVVKHFHPHLVELHNYASALGVSKKAINWHILNRKVFKKLGFEVNDDVIHNVTTCKQWAIEQFLMLLRQKISDVPVPAATTMAHQQHSVKSLPAGGGDRVDFGQAQDISMSPNSVSQPSVPMSYPRSSIQPRGVSIAAKMPDTDNGNCETTNPTKRLAPSGGECMTNDVVPRTLYDEKVQELLAKDETIEILHSKINRLEKLLKIKDIRIEDLQTRIHNTGGGSNGGVVANSPSQRSPAARFQVTSGGCRK